ncbi:hypothetical protein K435DRAFT_571690, partial [Dendrothele bispora CBS 962.96]
GWADLLWLLELNQGFYNMATLTAVCGLNDSSESGNGWLGPPIEPRAGSERLEPLATAFPVNVMDTAEKIHSDLNIAGARMIGLHPSLKRDSKALYRNPALRKAKLYSALSLIASWIIGATPSKTGLTLTAPERTSVPSSSVSNSTKFLMAGLLFIYFSSLIYTIFRLISGTWYLERTGWVFLGDEKMDDGSKGDRAWGSRPELVLGQVDRGLGRLADWGDRQMAPKWDEPEKSQYKMGHLIDLRMGIKHRVVVTGKPNSMAVLAVHGCGITYMLLDRPTGLNTVAKKLGMANLPPFTLAVAQPHGSIRVGTS